MPVVPSSGIGMSFLLLPEFITGTRRFELTTDRAFCTSLIFSSSFSSFTINLNFQLNRLDRQNIYGYISIHGDGHSHEMDQKMMKSASTEKLCDQRTTNLLNDKPNFGGRTSSTYTIHHHENNGNHNIPASTTAVIVV